MSKPSICTAVGGLPAVTRARSTVIASVPPPPATGMSCQVTPWPSRSCLRTLRAAASPPEVPPVQDLDFFGGLSGGRQPDREGHRGAGDACCKERFESHVRSPFELHECAPFRAVRSTDRYIPSASGLNSAARGSLRPWRRRVAASPGAMTWAIMSSPLDRHGACAKAFLPGGARHGLTPSVGAGPQVPRTTSDGARISVSGGSPGLAMRAQQRRGRATPQLTRMDCDSGERRQRVAGAGDVVEADDAEVPTHDSIRCGPEHPAHRMRPRR